MTTAGMVSIIALSYQARLLMESLVNYYLGIGDDGEANAMDIEGCSASHSDTTATPKIRNESMGRRETQRVPYVVMEGKRGYRSQKLRGRDGRKDLHVAAEISQF